MAVKVEWTLASGFQHQAVFTKRGVVGTLPLIRCVVESFMPLEPGEPVPEERFPYRIESGPLAGFVWALCRPGGRYCLNQTILADAEFPNEDTDLFDEIVDTLFYDKAEQPVGLEVAA